MCHQTSRVSADVPLQGHQNQVYTVLTLWYPCIWPWSYISGCPRYLRGPYWLSMGLPEMSGIACQICVMSVWHCNWKKNECICEENYVDKTIRSNKLFWIWIWNLNLNQLITWWRPSDTYIHQWSRPLLVQLSLVGRPAIIRTNLGLQIKRLRKTLAEAQENYWWYLCFYILPLPYILYLRDLSFIQYYTIWIDYICCRKKSIEFNQS